MKIMLRGGPAICWAGCRAACLTICLLLLLSACHGGAVDQATDAIQPPVPADYSGKTNPLGDDASSEAGRQLYNENCAVCHGETGLGDGPSAASLNPHPRPLAAEMEWTSDDYLFWRISEGGAMAPFHSAMPTWKKMLTEEQIWQIIAYLRSLS